MPDSAMSYLSCNQVFQLLTSAACSACAFAVTGWFLWSLWHTTCQGIQYLRRLHQIPCHRCVYFTGDYRLKCTVHPCKALTEDAIDCLDFERQASRVLASTGLTCQICVGGKATRFWQKRSH